MSANWADASDIGVGASKFLLSREPIVELTDGTLVLAAYFCSATHPERCYMIRSWDKGYVWTDRALVAEQNGRNHQSTENLIIMRWQL